MKKRTILAAAVVAALGMMAAPVQAATLANPPAPQLVSMGQGKHTKHAKHKQKRARNAKARHHHKKGV
jgi:hypothetical protein